MPEHRANLRRGPALIGGEAIDARVVLVGRTGQDARLRLDPTIELIRVRTGFDAIGELANPVGAVPGRTVVIVGAGSDIDERNGGDGAFVSAARRVAPDAVVLRAGDPGANQPMPGAYDGIVPNSASADELRELIHGPTRSAAAKPAPPARTVAATPDKAPQKAEDKTPDEPPAASLSPASLNGSHAEPSQPAGAGAGRPAETASRNSGGAGRSDRGTSIFADEELDEEELALLRDPEPVHPPLQSPAQPASTRSGPPASPAEGSPPAMPAPLVGAEMKPIEPSRFSGDGDDVLVAAALGGRDILEPALGLIRARVGRSDIEFVHDGDAADSPGVDVVWSGQRYGALRIAGIDAAMIATGSDDASGRLAHHARWLATWLALAEQHRRLRLEAYTDPVSGAWNRRYFDRFLEAALPHARQRRFKLTVLVFDLDNFKSFNDRFGHQAGDMILSETVRLLRSMTRPTDRICRIGGDEFAVVFYEPDGPRDTHSDHPQAFEIVAERFQKAVQEQRFPKLGIEAPGALTISGGLATFPWDGQAPAELLRRADELALASKAAGKNQITFGPGGGS